MRRLVMLSAITAVMLVGSGVALAERNLESGSAGSEPDVSCEQVIAAKSTAGKRISREKLAAKLHTSVDKVNQCLGAPRHSKTHKAEAPAADAH